MHTYQCICGKIFDNAQKFNGHKSNCLIHQQNKYGDLSKYYNRISIWNKAGVDGYVKKKQVEHKNKIDKWIKEQHLCKTCGKIMTEYYGSGIYCSRACANTRSMSEKTKQKISSTVKNHSNHNKQRKCRYCTDCGQRIKLSNKSGYCFECFKKHKTFSEVTRQKLRESAIKRNFGGFNFRNKGIYYNGQKLDSSYEVIVAKSLDANHIKWIRPKSLYYVDKFNKRRRYIPDFYLPKFDVYLDPKNDYLINNINTALGFSDKDKIDWVMQQNNVRVIILNKNQLEWDIIKTLI